MFLLMDLEKKQRDREHHVGNVRDTESGDEPNGNWQKTDRRRTNEEAII